MGNTVLWIMIASVVVAGVMEFLKHTKYKDNATVKQMTLWGILFSIIVTPIVYFGFELVGSYVAMILYAFIIFLVQKEVDMKAVRPVVKAILKKKADQL